ncbi:hypothetical protein EJB05_40041, partial [Eragrostis curvula]
MVSDQEIASCVESVIRGSAGGPGEVSLAAVLQQAEAKLGMDLSHKAHIQTTCKVKPAVFNNWFGVAYPFQLLKATERGYRIVDHTVGLLWSVSSSASKRKRGGPGGLNKVCAISPELQTIIGETAMSRTQIVKQLWAYIRQNNLQDPDDKRKIICNDELRVVFGTDTTDMFKMNKLLAKHITPLDPKDQIPEVKRMKAPTMAPQLVPPINQPSVVISDALAKFIGTEGTVPQDDALKYLWDYIKANQLEDVINDSILCDSKLQELFGCESIPVSGLSEMLSHHFIKQT